MDAALFRRFRVAILKDLVARGWRPPSRLSLRPHQAERLIDDIASIGGDRRGAGGGQPRGESLALTPHELRLLDRFANGDSAPQIAAQLHISLESVKSEAKQIRLKLGARTMTHAVALALSDGLIGRRAA